MRYQKGFSLVELAIVLVIIGLITGGILTGQELIRASELNSVSSDVNKIQVAINTFKLKYNGLPGDIPNASSYWTTCASPATLCNGNNDGVIGNVYANAFVESARVWQILGLSGLISGSYPGTYGPVGDHDHLIGVTSPALKISGAGMAIGSWGYQDTVWLYAGNYQNAIFLGSYTSGDYPQGNFLTPTEAQSIDSKYDDGKPGVGKWRIQRSAGGCHSAPALGSAAVYTLATATVSCPMMYVPMP